MRISDWSSDVCSSDLIMPGVTADVGLLYYFYPKDGNAATDFFEPYASLSGSLGPVNAKVGLAYAWEGQNALGNDDDIYVYTDLSTAVPGTPFKLKGHVGYSDGSLAPLAGAQSGNYWDWSVGAEARSEERRVGKRVSGRVDHGGGRIMKK